MSADFEKVLVKDPRLDVSDAIKYAVIKGGQNVTMVKLPAVAYSNSQLVWNVQVPSEQTIIDRRVLINATVDITITTGTGMANTYIAYGINAALASFPIHQCMTTLSATINNNTVTCNIDDVLPAVIRLLDNEDLVYNNSYSPAFNEMLGTYYTAGGTGYLANANTSLWACTSREDWHRGAFPIKTSNAALSATSVKLTYELTEPLLLSPFMFSKTKSNNQGFYGIQNMNIVANLNNGATIFRGPTTGAKSFVNPSGTNRTADGIQNITVDFTVVKPNLFFTYLTPHPSDLMPARNIVPYYELPRYINGGQPEVAAGSVVNSAFVYGSETLLTFNSIQLNQIPDRLILFVRRTKSRCVYVPPVVGPPAVDGFAGVWGVPDAALPISKISINFNNNSGILASAENQQLWEMSKNNGANTNWTEWYGVGTSINTALDTVSTLPLSGSYLVLEFGKDIQLTEDFYASGSLGNFNLQMNVYCRNNTLVKANAGDVELVVITMNSGVFVCERGTSATYTGILTKQDVLEASAQEYYTHDDVKRIVGGGFWDSIKSGVSSLAKKGLKMGKEHLAKHGKSYMQQGLKMAANTGKKMLKKYTAPDDDDE